MDFQPTDEQEQLRASVRSVLRQACPPGLVRQVFEASDETGAAGVAGPLWRQMVDLDWPTLAIPEEFGGLGLGFVELCLVAEELGRAVAPGPFIPTVTQFVPMVRETANPSQAKAVLTDVGEGRTTGTLALAEPANGSWDPARIEASARRQGGGWVLQGRKAWVLDGATADLVAVVAREEGTSGRDGLGVFLVDGVAVRSTPVPAVDPTQPLAQLDLDGVHVGGEQVLGQPGDPEVAGALDRAIQEATVCLASSLTGTCRAIFETTLQYAKDREQYGRPIGSFQALKHRLVDMYMALERAAALATFAALTIAENDERRAVAASMAKAAAGDCQRLVVEDGLQLHGGIGFTWENDLQMFLKRAKAGDLLFGTARRHRAEVARLLGVER